MKKPGVVFMLVSSIAIMSIANAQSTHDSYNKARIFTNLAAGSLVFTNNQGQFGDETLFKTSTGEVTFFFCRNEVVYMFARDTDEPIEENSHSMLDMPMDIDRPQYKKESLSIKAQFVGANPGSDVIGLNRMPHNNNYFYGNDPSKWYTDVPNYSAILYKDIYPGIDLKYHGNGQGMKYDFIVFPGADISQIRIRYEGVDNLDITPDGDLEATTLFGPILEKKPIAYQRTGIGEREVGGRYVIREPGVFGFEVDEYNPSLTLTIDPELVYSTYLGGNNVDYAYGIAVDDNGSAYIVGYTFSTDFPVLNPYQADQGGHDVFVTKLAPGGNSLAYSTYLGGSYNDFGRGIAVDGNGCAYVTGYTYSTDFPTLNPYQTDQGGNDIFVTKLSSAGNSLVYSTYLGGNDGDRGKDIAIDDNGCSYITGRTLSADFPTVNCYQTHQGDWDAFVSKFSPGGDSLFYSTYLGGTDDDRGWDIGIDGSGCAYVTGSTSSSDFPTLNPYQMYQGESDAYVIKLAPAGSTLVYSTYLGGSDFDCGWGISIDSGGIAYVAGQTESSDFPTLNPYQTHQGSSDAIVAKLSSAGNSLLFGTYLGGSEWDWGWNIVVDGNGSSFVIGTTRSADFPTLNPYQMYQGEYDAFVTMLSSSGNTLAYSTFLGGNDNEYGRGIAIDGDGNAYVIGRTESTDFPTLNPYQTYQSEWDVFVTKFGPVTGINENISILPQTYQLLQNYPNPFNGSTCIYYNLPKGCHVNISIYDILGRRVADIVNGFRQPGHHQANWNASGYVSGIYFYKIEAGDYSETKKMILLK
jgi:hypothetical protein